jgi:sugar phosphate isomerase/epimerase
MPQFDFAYILRSPAYYADNASFLEDLRAVRHAGFKAIELQLKSPYDLEQPMLRRMLADEALRLAGFQTGSAYRSQRLCLASPDAATRRRTVDLLKAIRGSGSIVQCGSRLRATARNSR